MENLLRLWYVKSPSRAWELYLRTLGEVEISVGVRDMLRNLGRPLFQDYTWQGRLIGLLIRLVRIAVGLLVYALIALLYLALYAVWLAFPLICVTALIGSFAGAS